MLVDTDILIDYLRGYPEAVSFLEENIDRVSISAVSVAELYQGVREGTERTALRSMTSAFTVLALTDEIAEIAGLYRRDYGKQLGCGLADCMIAATADFHDLELGIAAAEFLVLQRGESFLVLCHPLLHLSRLMGVGQRHRHHGADSFFVERLLAGGQRHENTAVLKSIFQPS